MSRKRILIVTDLHYCHENYGGIDSGEKIELLVNQINDEYSSDPFEFILFLGDYSLDHWAWNVKGSWLVHGKSYTAEMTERYFGDLPTPYYMLAGNHEQYGNEMWKKLTGCEREAVAELDDSLFILWDSFGGDLDPTEHSDGTYTAPSVEKIRAIMDDHPNKRVFLCSHWFAPNGTEEEKELIRDKRIACLFVGHSHRSSIVTLPEEYGKKQMIQCGAWASVSTDDTFRWGVRDLVLDGELAVSSYIIPYHEITIDGNTVKVEAVIKDVANI